MRRAEVTAFLSLIFVLLLSFILALTESAQIQTAKNYARMNVDRAIFSLFGEYHKILLEEYNVFGVDVTYGTGEYEEQWLFNRLSYYGAKGTEQEIQGIQFLTDNQGQAFREQVLAYIEEKTGFGILKDITGLSGKWEEQTIKGEQFSGQLEESLQEYESVLPQEAENLLQKKKKGILALVAPESLQLSEKAISIAEQSSERMRQRGYGSFPVRTSAQGISGKMLFSQYVQANFNSAVNQVSEERNLDYELEYILSGKASDIENLRNIVQKLLLVRLALNCKYLFSDTEKQSQAEAMALGFSAIMLNPELKEAVKVLLIVLWGFMESVIELKALLSGRKVANIKNSSNWQLSIFSLFLPSTYTSTMSEDVEEGTDYQTYLQTLLFLENKDTVTMRTLDRVEQNIRMEEGQENFHIDKCISKIRINNTTEIGMRYTYKFPAAFGYY